MDAVNKTLYIPLYGKALVSKKGIVLHDPKAEEIWEKESFPLKGKAASKWLAYYMGMRARVFDTWTREQLLREPEAVVLHIGCGMDSRVCRVNWEGHLWYDIDFPDVIRQRACHYPAMEGYTMIPSDARDTGYLEAIPGGSAIVILEGISMYLRPGELVDLLARLNRHFDRLAVLMDCYTVFAARASKYKNPVNAVGVTTLYGMDDPRLPEKAGLTFLAEHSLTPEARIRELPGWEQSFFRKVIAGGMAKKIYRLYEYSSEKT